jgi:autotransporter-associated beta strand protein
LNDNRMQRWYGSRTGNSLGATDSGQSAQGQGNPVNAPGGGGGDGGFSYATGNVFNGGNGLGRNPSVQVNGGGTVTVGGSNSYSFNGALIANGTITGSSTRVGGTELGVGTITLSGNNTYTGGTTVNGGTVVVGNSGQINWNPNSYAGKPSSGSGPNLNEAAPSHARPAMREAVGELFALHVGDEMSRDSLSDLSIPGRADSGGMDHASGAEFAGRRTGRPVTEGKEQVLGRATAATPQYETRTEGRSTPGTNVWLHARAVETDRANQAIISDVVDARRSHESAPARSAGLVAAEIELPAGGVELDYGCPSGQPELTLTIVREDLVTGGWGLATALIGLAVLALAAMIGRRVRRKG